MVNHMEEVAKLLGVELGEEFDVIGYPSIHFVFSVDGLYCYSVNSTYRTASKTDNVLRFLLSGEITIKRKPWKPLYGYVYWYVHADGCVTPTTWLQANSDMSLYKLGNCYRTKEEAEADRDKWISFYASDEQLTI